MAKYGPLKRPSKAHLPLLVFLADNPSICIVSCAGSNNYYYADMLGKRVEDGPDIRSNIAIHRLIQSGWLRIFEKESLGKDHKWSWYDHPFAITEDGIKIANKHRSEYEQDLVDQVKARAEMERMVIIRNNSQFGEKRNYATLCKVVNETPKRLYVESLSKEWNPSIEGRKGNEYVNRKHVVVDNATKEQYDELRSVEDNHIDWLNALKQLEHTELNSIRDRYTQRREQGQAMFEDELNKIKRKF